MTYQDLLISNKNLKEVNLQQAIKIESLEFELSKLKKLIFGAKHERFVSNVPDNQATLFDIEAIAEKPEEQSEEISYKRKKKRKAPDSFKRHSFPKDLKREETIIEPEGIDLEQHTKIGEEVTEILAYTPASLYVKKTVRPKYVLKTGKDAGVKQAKMPVRLIPKGIVDESLIVGSIVEKILHHTPIHRFNKKLKQVGVNFISDSNLYNWFHKGAEMLLPLQNIIQQDLLAQNYLQADETTITVLTKNKKGSSHRGYIWVLYNPELKLTYYQYHKSRSSTAAKELLQKYSGKLQVDGYEVYESISKELKIKLSNCLAHARRKFVEAKNNDPPKAKYYLEKVQQLYQLEEKLRQARNQTAQLQDYKTYIEYRLKERQKQALPILQELGEWLKTQLSQVLPKSSIGKAVTYNIRRWKGLTAYAYDGALEIDNNLIENTIRPIAIGRKNYLFAGNDKAAENLACLYTIVATAKQHNLNVQKYLEWLLRKAVSEKMTDANLRSYLPYNFSPEQLIKFKVQKK